MNGGRIRAAILGAALVVTFAASGAVRDPDALRRGEQIYDRCSGCHSIEGNRTGRSTAACSAHAPDSVPGYDGYSSAMRKSGIVWNERTLDKFLQEPLKTVPGTAMATRVSRTQPSAPT